MTESEVLENHSLTQNNEDIVKDPILATLLNIIPGVGYLYVGRRKLFGALILASLVLVFSTMFDPSTAQIEETETSSTVWDWLVLGGIILFEAAFMYDAGQDALKLNAKKKSK